MQMLTQNTAIKAAFDKNAKQNKHFTSFHGCHCFIFYLINKMKHILISVLHPCKDLSVHGPQNIKSPREI